MEENNFLVDKILHTWLGLWHNNFKIANRTLEWNHLLSSNLVFATAFLQEVCPEK